jgi:hypothetical protein
MYIPISDHCVKNSVDYLHCSYSPSLRESTSFRGNPGILTALDRRVVNSSILRLMASAWQAVMTAVGACVQSSIMFLIHAFATSLTLSSSSAIW